MSEQAFENLKKYWGYDSFRPGQDEVIASVLSGRNTMVLFPTGGGKSLCYQLPATVLDGLTVVISPLIALMQDQVQQLNDHGISATFVNSTISSWEVEQRLVNARNGMYDLLYCSPERLKTNLWEAELPNLNISLLAIDEAHCISEWGHDFRPSYREILPAMESIANEVTWIALTATATPEVRDDIQKNLGFEDPVIVSKGFDRPNLKWWVTRSEQKEQKLLQAVKRAAPRGAGLVYGGTRRNCEDLANKITGKLNIPAKAYHAGVDAAVRKQIQEEWISGKTPLVVATSAFGMGIDKADCRYVIHYEMPYSLEAYYQEAGRAGRDGKESFPLLLYKPSDAIIAENRIKDSYPKKEQLQHIYDVLCDELNLAVGSEMEELQEVSIKALQKRSGFSHKISRSALNVLSQIGIIQLVDYMSSQVGVRFVANPEMIREKIEDLKNQKKAEFLDTLFRQYGGEAFDKMKYLEFDYLQRKLNVSPNAIKKGLHVLQDHDHLLTYETIGELPMVKLVEERQSSLNINRNELEKHRNSLLKKLDHMKGYIETETCREVYIRHYFGEDDVKACGHCDNCLSMQQSPIPITQTDIYQIKEMLSEEAKSFKQIRQQFGWSESKAKQSLGYLVREEKVIFQSEKYHWNQN
ncbi:MAG TPA: ATP-dependent DNA helicase RecQ [Balneolaceae bacterium]|nr:ATP-dependent DNA helicase RecQ [Balneolaceae bacterium]